MRSLLLRKMVNWGMSAKTFGTFRRKTKTAASRPDKWPGNEQRNCVVREQHDFAARTQNVVHGRPVNQSIYLFICVSIYLPTAGLDPPVETHEKSIYQRTKRAATIPRPPLESSWRGESKSAVTIFVKFILTSFSK